MFPIKYIENNLIWNQNNEVYAYYEMIPYNYSFLSPDEKEQVHNQFWQLIGQQRAGNIHALQIATESSVRAIQNKAKEDLKGSLANVAIERIDAQSDALVEMIGDSQVDYRYFFGFKLLSDEEEINLENIKKSLIDTFKSFLEEVNQKAMGDFLSMPDEEVRRYQKAEKLLESKITRRFKFRRITKDDIGYLLDHVYGQINSTYEDYYYDLPKKKIKGKTLVKRYDLLRPSRCQIEEKQRSMKITGEKQETYVSCFTINNIVGELEFPGSEVFFFQQQQFDFPVDTSMNIEVIENKKALTKVRNKKKELIDLDDHAEQNGGQSSDHVVEALEDTYDLETSLSKTKDAMYKVSYVVRVSADTKDELKMRCDEIRDFYDDLEIKLVRPFGDIKGLFGEFIPTSKRYEDDYIQYVTSDFLASLGFGATQQLGEDHGIYIGYNVDTGKNVYIQPALAAQGVKGSVTNALAMAFLGSLGGGKSMSSNLIMYYSGIYGAKNLILDPKSERGNWADDLPEIRDQLNIVNLTSEEKNRGLLDPYIIMKDRKDAQGLVVDILTYLTGISNKDADKFPVLMSAIRNVTEQPKPGLLKVIEELKKQGSSEAMLIATHIESFADCALAVLLFSDGEVQESISLNKQFNILQVADLMLPEPDKEADTYTITEVLSVALMIVIASFALNFIQEDRSDFKIVGLDEAWSFMQVTQGKALSNKLVRAGRAMNAAVYFMTQNTDDLSDEKMKNNIGIKFAFRSTDLVEIKKTLQFFGLDPEDVGNQEKLRSLENGQALMQDLYGHVGVIQFHVVFADLFKAFDTRPPVEEKGA